MTIGHHSDCATHNMPAYPNGPCDCGCEDRLRAEIVALREAASWATAALATLQEYEKDDAPLPDDHEFGRILESRGSPSFRIRAGHIRKLAAALATA